MKSFSELDQTVNDHVTGQKNLLQKEKLTAHIEHKVKPQSLIIDGSNIYVGIMLRIYITNIEVQDARFFFEVFSDVPSRIDLAFSML